MNKTNKNDLPLSLQSLEDLKKSIDGWVNNADLKATTVLLFNGAIITILSAKFPDIKKVIMQASCTNYFSTFILILSSLYLITFGISLFYVFKTLKPDVRSRTSSLFFFGSIASMSSGDFVKKMTALKESEARKMLSEQIHTNSTITTNKFRTVNNSVVYLFLSIIFFVLMILSISFV